MILNEQLKERAKYFENELSNHCVLKKYWNQISLILKGSTARGYSDEYSDLDFVIFTDFKTKMQIVSEYIENGLSTRQDGIFLPLGDWEGHYNIDTYDDLIMYFCDNDIEQIWEYTNVIILHDPIKVYENLISKHSENLFDNYENIVMNKYLEIQLNIDWLRQPLRRADNSATFIYCSKIISSISQITYLIEKKTFPCAKWIFYYLDKTPTGILIKEKLTEYEHCCHEFNQLTANLDLMEYPQYKVAIELLDIIIPILKEKFSNKQWIDEWYLYA